MISKIEASTDPVMQYTIDVPEDVDNLPHSGISAGSTAICIATGEVYIFNGRTWYILGGAA